jgi:sugar-specific transcriptional regulator TrmB
MQSFDEIESQLREIFKLSSYEAKSYLSLLKFGKQTPKELATNAGIPLPRIYDTLETLMSKGFALRQGEFYSPIPPKTALHGRTVQFEKEFAKEQMMRQSVEKDLASFLEKASVQSRERAEDEGEISVLKGFNSIANKFGELLSESNEIILVAKRAVEAKEVFIPILLEYTGVKRARRKSIRIIVPKDTKVTEEELRAAGEASAEIRKSDQILFDMMITDQNDVLIGVPDPLSEEINHAIAIWFRNSSFAKSTKNAVEEVWKNSQRIQ